MLCFEGFLVRYVQHAQKFAPLCENLKTDDLADKCVKIPATVLSTYQNRFDHLWKTSEKLWKKH